jgi:hypothetical protein
MHGSDNGVPSRPDARAAFADSVADRINNVFGSARGNNISSIGFRTARGSTYGPYGPGSSLNFSVDGHLLGFFGVLANGIISGIGVWYTPIVASTPGTPPFQMKLEMSPAYGSLSNVWTWDDTPNMGGAHFLLNPVDGRMNQRGDDTPTQTPNNDQGMNVCRLCTAWTKRPTLLAFLQHGSFMSFLCCGGIFWVKK